MFKYLANLRSSSQCFLIIIIIRGFLYGVMLSKNHKPNTESYIKTHTVFKYFDVAWNNGCGLYEQMQLHKMDICMTIDFRVTPQNTSMFLFHVLFYSQDLVFSFKISCASSSFQPPKLLLLSNNNLNNMKNQKCNQNEG